MCFVAETEGFEPSDRVNGRRFSRPVHSTTLPSLRNVVRTGYGSVSDSARGAMAHFSTKILSHLRVSILPCARGRCTPEAQRASNHRTSYV